MPGPDNAVPVQLLMVSVLPAQVTKLLAAKEMVWAVPEAKSMVELEFKFKVFEFVQVLVAVIPVVVNLPPFKII